MQGANVREVYITVLLRPGISGCGFPRETATMWTLVDSRGIYIYIYVCGCPLFLVLGGSPNGQTTHWEFTHVKTTPYDIHHVRLFEHG